LAVVLGACGGDAAVDRDASSTDGAVGGDAAPVSNPLDGIADVELVQEGFMFLEGPAWRAADGVLLFSDIPADTIYQLAPPATVTPFRNPSGESNGLASDINGLLLAAEHGNRRVSRTMAGGQVVEVAGDYEGASLNSPNDVAVRGDGTIYFTDPPYGIAEAERELDFNGVFRVAPNGTLTVEWPGALATRPNGIALSPDERTLYVADTAGPIRAYDVATDGSLSGERVFTDDIGNADGLAVDDAGNVFAAASDGVRVFSPSGATWGTIAVPRQPANQGFGGPAGTTLYITAQQGLYRVELPIPGLR
jgi:gluconolactonase